MEISRLIVTPDGRQYEKAGFGHTIGAIVAGGATYAALNYPIKLIKKDAYSYVSKHLEPYEFFDLVFKQLQKSSNGIQAKFVGWLGLATAICGLMAFWSRPMAPGEKPEGFWDKTCQFMKKNIILLYAPFAVASCIPNKIAEAADKEYIQAIKAKLSPQAFETFIKKVKNGKTAGYIGAAMLPFGAWLAVKVRDMLSTPKEITPDALPMMPYPQYQPLPPVPVQNMRQPDVYPVNQNFVQPQMPQVQPEEIPGGQIKPQQKAIKPEN